MIPLKIEGAVNYGAPKDWDAEKHGECQVLPVVRANGCCLSVWRPTEEERQALLQGQAIVLSVVGGQPPVSLSVADIRGEQAWSF